MPAWRGKRIDCVLAALKLLKHDHAKHAHDLYLLRANHIQTMTGSNCARRTYFLFSAPLVGGVVTGIYRCNFPGQIRSIVP